MPVAMRVRGLVASIGTSPVGWSYPTPAVRFVQPSDWLMALELLYRTLAVSLAPQARQVPPPPFDTEALQRAYMDVSRAYSYAQFGLLPANEGVQFANGPQDMVLIQPGIVQIITPIDTTERTQAKTIEVFRIIADRLQIATFFNCGFGIIVHVPAPGPDPDAQVFVAQQLMGGEGKAKVLGENFVDAGIKYRAADAEHEENLLVEPLIVDTKYVWVNYTVQRQGEAELEKVSEWLSDGFEFIRQRAMSLLEA
jgi:hypothetical protein